MRKFTLDEISYQVGRSSLLLANFTLGDLSHVTGLRIEVIKQELEKLVERGSVVVKGEGYTLSPDQSKRLALAIWINIVSERISLQDQRCDLSKQEINKRLQALEECLALVETQPEAAANKYHALERDWDYYSEPNAPAFTEAVKLVIAEPFDPKNVSEWIEAAWQTEGGIYGYPAVQGHLRRLKGIAVKREGNSEEAERYFARAAENFRQDKKLTVECQEREIEFCQKASTLPLEEVLDLLRKRYLEKED